MSHSLWATEVLRFFALVALAVVGSRLVLWAADEPMGPRTGAGLFAWLLRGIVVWGLASCLGYV